MAPMTPTQERVLAALRDGDRPDFDAELAPSLRADLDAALAGLDLPPPSPYHVTKHSLTGAHSCHAHLLASRRWDGWTVRAAVGTVAHKAIELGLHWPANRGEATPALLVEAAIERLRSSDTTIAEFLCDLPAAEHAELTSIALDRVVKFADCLPPLPRSWTAATELALLAHILDGRVALRGRVDLAIGKPVGTRAGRLLVDLKTGGRSSIHLDDLRYYALVETLRAGVPPFRLAVLYLDAGEVLVENVSEALLGAALARTIDGIRALAELESRPLHLAARRAGPPCRWCPLRDGCQVADRAFGDDDGGD